jgi:hypothetical protein
VLVIARKIGEVQTKPASKARYGEGGLKIYRFETETGGVATFTRVRIGNLLPL